MMNVLICMKEEEEKRGNNDNKKVLPIAAHLWKTLVFQKGLANDQESDCTM